MKALGVALCVVAGVSLLGLLAVVGLNIWAPVIGIDKDVADALGSTGFVFGVVGGIAGLVGFNLLAEYGGDL